MANGCSIFFRFRREQPQGFQKNWSGCSFCISFDFFRAVFDVEHRWPPPVVARFRFRFRFSKVEHPLWTYSKQFFSAWVFNPPEITFGGLSMLPCERHHVCHERFRPLGHDNVPLRCWLEARKYVVENFSEDFFHVFISWKLFLIPWNIWNPLP